VSGTITIDWARLRAQSMVFRSVPNARSRKDMNTVRKLLANADAVIVCVLVVIVAGLLWLPTGFPTNEYPGSIRAKVEILQVDNSNVHSVGGLIREGSQDCEVRIADGKFRGTVAYATNNFIGKLEIDKVFLPGDTALAVVDFVGEEVTHVVLVDHYRISLELVLFAAFTLLLIIFAGWTGFKALLSFVLSVLLIWKVLIPLFLRGFNPLLVAMAVVVVMTFFIMILVAGFNRKSLVAILGSLAGTALTCCLAISFGHAFRIHGSILPYSESLLYAGYAHLNLTDIFIAAIFIASSGALMDLAMDISASVHEVVEKKPDITTREAIQSGFTIGRAVIGTMTTTLLLAYSGGYVALLMVFMAQGTPLINILNLRYVAGEILHTIVGSFGLVTVAPITAVLAGVIYTRRPAGLEQAKAVLPQPPATEALNR